MDETTKEEFYRHLYRQSDSSDDEIDSFVQFRTKDPLDVLYKQPLASEETPLRLQSSSQVQNMASLNDVQAMPSLPSHLRGNYISSPDEFHRWLKPSKKTDMVMAKTTRLKGYVLLYWPLSPDSKPVGPRKRSLAGVIEHGGILAKEWDGGHRITHIIVDSPGIGREYKDVLRNLKLDGMPSNVQLVTAGWVNEKIKPRLPQLPSSEDLFRVSGYTKPTSTAKGNEADHSDKKREGTNILERDKVKKPKLQQSEPPSNDKHTLKAQADLNAKYRSPKLMKQQKTTSVGTRLGAKAIRSDMASEIKDTNYRDEIMEYVQRAKTNGDILELILQGGTAGTAATADGANIDRMLRSPGEDLDVEYDSTSSEEATPLGKAKGFLCARSNVKGSVERGPNAALIEQMKYLAEYYANRKDDIFRAKGYREAISAVRRQEHQIVTKEQAAQLRGIGTSIAAKIEEFVKYGTIKLVDELMASPRHAAIKLFTGIYGVGPRTAEEWYNAGKSSLEQLQDIPLHEHQRIGLEHYDDFNTRIPRDEVSLHVDFVTKAAKEVNEHLEVVVAGSYRRGELNSGDIDFLITAPDLYVNDKHLRSLVFEQLLPALQAAGYIKANLTTPSENDSSKWMGAACLPGLETEVWRRVDLLVVPNAEWGAALLYFTGNDIFNRSMRLLARKSRKSLNQRGLYKGVIRENGKKIAPGILVEARDERKIFEALEVKWRPPHERCP